MNTSKFLKIIVTIIAIPVILFVSMVIYYIIKDSKQDDSSETAGVTATSTQVQESQSDQGKASSEPELEEKVVAEADTINKVTVDSAKDTQNDTSKGGTSLPAGERLATEEERVKMTQAISGLMKIINSGTRNEIKYALGYADATADEKAQFDAMTKSEFEEVVEMVADLLNSAVGILSNPSEYDVVIYENPDGILDVAISSRSTAFYESYDFSFKVTDGEWEMVNL